VSKRELRPDLDYQKAFGIRVRKLREEVGWTQVDLAIHAGISEYQISVIENGHQGPNFQTLRAIAIALGIHPKDLFDFKYPLKLNTSFPQKERESPGATKLIHNLILSSFFGKERTVSDVVSVIKNQFNRKVTSSEVSSILLAITRRNELHVTQRNGRNYYRKFKLSTN
jgi:transcriptional regulator with XRE-family HTH domain